MAQALGVCAASVLSRAIARDLFEGEALSRTLALTMVAMAAAPGFSPLLGSAIEFGPGWRGSFALVALLGLLLVLAYAAVLGETHPSDRRAAATPPEVLRGYATLWRDVRFIGPALVVSVIVGGLYAFFAAAPAVLMGSMGLSALQLGLFFAGTVFVVFGTGMLAPRLAHRWGPAAMVRLGCVAALGGALGLLARGENAGLMPFTGAIVLYLLGMGLVNPLGTALALGPFSRQAGLASSLLAGLAGRSPAPGLAVPFISTIYWEKTMLRTTETMDSLFERQRGTLPGTFGVRPLALAEGRMTMELTIAPWMMAPNGFLHAATQVMLADTCAGYATLAHLPEGAKGFTTLELKSNFLGTAKEGVLSVEAVAEHLGRTTQVWSATVVDAKGRKLSLFRCSQIILW